MSGPVPFRVAGFGLRPGAGRQSLMATLRLAAGDEMPSALATIPEREAALRPLAQELGLPLHLVAVAGIATPTRSARVLASHGTGSVAEAAALVAAGPGARLVVGRVVSPDGMVTCAVAEGETI